MEKQYKASMKLTRQHARFNNRACVVGQCVLRKALLKENARLKNEARAMRQSRG